MFETPRYNENSKFWLNDKEIERLSLRKNDQKPLILSEIVEKTQILKTISNFVNIVTDSNLPVNFEGQQAKSDGKSVTISANVKDFDSVCGLSLHEASHVKYSQYLHKLLGTAQEDFNRAIKYEPHSNELVTKTMQLITKWNKRTDANILKLYSYVHDIMNILEDVRIDNLSMNNFPGYEGYYKALLDQYLFTDQVNKALDTPKFHEETFFAYKMQICTYTRQHPKSSLHQFKGGSEIIDLIDLKNIHLKSAEDILNLTFDIVEVIHKYVIENKSEDSKQNNKDSQKSNQKNKSDKKDDSDEKTNGDSDNEESGEEGGNDDLDNMENEDEENKNKKDNKKNNSDNEESDKESKNSDESEDENDSENENESDESEDKDEDSDEESDDESEDSEDESDEDSEDEKENKSNSKNENKSEKSLEDELDKDIKDSFTDSAIKKLMDALDNKFDKKSLTEDEANIMDLLVNNNKFKIVKTKVVDTDHQKTCNVDVVVINKLDNDVVKYFHGIIDPNDHHLFKAVNDGLNQGKRLGSKLQLMNDEHLNVSTRKKSGNISNRLLAEVGHGNTKIFDRITVTEYEKQFIHISIDSSGSMSGTRFYNSIQMAASIAGAAEYINGMRVQVTIRSTTNFKLERNSTEFPYVAIIYDSKFDSINHIKKWWPILETPGGTPEAICFEAIKDIIIDSSRDKHSFFVNISDGSPAFNTRTMHYNFYIKHTQEVMKIFRNAGIKVISYFIDGDPTYNSNFGDMYGKDAKYINVNNVNEIAASLNKSFLTK